VSAANVTEAAPRVSVVAVELTARAASVELVVAVTATVPPTDDVHAPRALLRDPAIAFVAVEETVRAARVGADVPTSATAPVAPEESAASV
jgi:hypothetical protein